MANPYEQFVTPPKPPGAPEGNPYLRYMAAPTVDPDEQGVISRVNNPTEESPAHFGFQEIPERSLFDYGFRGAVRAFAASPVEAAATQAIKTGELAQATQGESALDTAKLSLAAQLQPYIEKKKMLAPGIFGFAELAAMELGIAKDVLVSMFPKDAKVPERLIDAGNALSEKVSAAIKKFGLERPTGRGETSYDIGSTFASILQSITLSKATGSPAPAAALFYTLQDSAIYKEAREKGLSPHDAARIANESGAANAAIEYYGGKYFLGGLSSPFIKRVMLRTLGQGVEEATQQAAEETITRREGLRDGKISEAISSVGYAGMLGLIGGAPVSAIVSAMERQADDAGLDAATKKTVIGNFLKSRDEFLNAAERLIHNEASGIARSQADEDSALAVRDALFAEDQRQADAANDPEEFSPDERVALQGFLNDEEKGMLQENGIDISLDDQGRIPPPRQPQPLAKEEYITALESRLDEIEVRLKVLEDGEQPEMRQEAETLRKEIEAARNAEASPYPEIDQRVSLMAPHEQAQRFERLNRQMIDGFKLNSREIYEHAALTPGRAASKIPGGAQRGEVYAKVIQESRKRGSGIGGRAGDVMRDTRVMLESALTPISTRLKNINPKLKARLRKFEFDLRQRINDDQAIAEPFLRKYAALPRDVRTVLDFALKNGDTEIIDEIAAAYEMKAEIKAVRKMLNSIYLRGADAGLEIGYIENYFPRYVERPEKLIAHFQGTEEWGQISEALRQKERELGTPLTAEDKAELLNTVLRGYGRAQIALAKPGNLKARRIDEITPEIANHYAPSDQALLRYIAAVNNNIESRRFFGKGSPATKPDNINDSIAYFVLQEMAAGNVKPSQEQELTEILQARFKQGRMGAAFRTYKNVEYLSTMGSPVSAITQLGDLAFAFYRSGIYRTLAALPRAVAGRSTVTREDIGITEIAEEFNDPGSTGKAVRAVFKAIGFDKMDALGKEVLINSALSRMRAQAKRPSKEFRESLELVLGEETDTTIADLKAGKISENVKLLLFNELLDLQPVALSEMPAAYLRMGNGRILYMLKTFTIKQLDVYRNEVFSQILSTNPSQVVKGLRNLTRLLAFFVAMGASADFLKDLLLGRETPPEDYVANNLLRAAGISKYQVYTARREGVGKAAFSTIAPPFSVVDRGFKDFSKAVEEGEVNPDELESVQNLPLAGKFYYWWFGAGAD